MSQSHVKNEVKTEELVSHLIMPCPLPAHNLPLITSLVVSSTSPEHFSMSPATVIWGTSHRWCRAIKTPAATYMLPTT